MKTRCGPIILQATVPVLDETRKQLFQNNLKEEHRIYSQAVKMVLEGKYKIEGRRVLGKLIRPCPAKFKPVEEQLAY